MARSSRSALTLWAVVALLVPWPTGVAAQLSDPCDLACAAVLGGTAAAAATGAVVAVGRLTGGMSTVDQGLLAWGTAFAVVLGGGFALAGNGERQERGVYSAGVGTLAGAVTGLAIGALRTRGDAPRVLAGTLIGAMTGAVLGGVYGAVSHEGDAPSAAGPLFTLHLSF